MFLPTVISLQLCSDSLPSLYVLNAKSPYFTLTTAFSHYDEDNIIHWYTSFPENSPYFDMVNIVKGLMYSIKIVLTSFWFSLDFFLVLQQIFEKK